MWLQDQVNQPALLGGGDVGASASRVLVLTQTYNDRFVEALQGLLDGSIAGSWDIRVVGAAGLSGLALPTLAGDADVLWCVGFNDPAMLTGMAELRPMVLTDCCQFERPASAPPIVHVSMDAGQVSQRVLEHLSQCGVKHFAMLGSEHEPGFMAVVQAMREGTDQKLLVECCDHEHRPMCTDRLADWLRRLTKPCGLYVDSVVDVMQVVRLAKIMQLRMPGELFLIAGDDHVMYNETEGMGVTAVSLPWYKLGMLVGLQLDLILSGCAVDDIAVCDATLRMRRSTFDADKANRYVRQAIGYIQQHALDPCTVEQVLDQVNCSRSYLDACFRKQLGYPVFGEIRRRRINHARQLLTDTNRSIDKIAAACGFKSTRRFSEAFRSEVGMPPSQFRIQSRLLNVL